MGKVAHIEDVVVDKEYRSHGLGKLLIQDGIKIAIERNVIKLYWIVKRKMWDFTRSVGLKKKEFKWQNIIKILVIYLILLVVLWY